MREVKRSAIVGRTPRQMYALINDIEEYPSFLPWCTFARVESRGELEIVATLGVRRGVLQTEFTTCNRLDPERSVVMEQVRGPFRSLTGTWLLTPIGDVGSRIELTMTFEFGNPLSATIFEPLFEETAASLVDAFVARAKSLDA